MAKVRLQKVIAAAGLASRREAERFIEAGRVTVDGEVVQRLGTVVDPQRSDIRLDGKPVRAVTDPIYLMMNKPRGVMATSHDPEGRRTIMDFLGEVGQSRGPQRVFHVGRLDYHSEGLLLLTNDGDLALALTHPSNGVPRVYRARVRGHPTQDCLRRLVAGIELEDGRAAVADLEVLETLEKSTWLELTVVEGRNRLVRRLLEAVGHLVQRLVRVEYGGLELGDLPSGAVRALTREEVEMLRRWGGASPRQRVARGAGRTRSGVRT